ncbi:MAG: 2-C-methyl-D-erythritol 2,4-cyclodiphosphate synthase, partial [uncultured Solirubrobacteraceae bacterium]
DHRAHRDRRRLAPLRRGPSLRARRSRDRPRPGTRRPLRRRRADPRGHRRRAGCGGARRHRPALPGHRPALRGSRLAGPARRGARARRAGRPAGGARRRHRHARAAEARAPARGDRLDAGRRAGLLGEPQGDHRRGDGLRRAPGGRGGDGGGDARGVATRRARL